MRMQEAYQILNLPINSSEEDIKKAFKKLAIQYHPDKNKDADAEDKFKKINEAYQTLTNSEVNNNFSGANPFAQQRPTGFVNINFSDIFSVFENSAFENNFTGQVFINGMPFGNNPYIKPRIVGEISLSLSEALLGCTKVLKIKRKVQCDSVCNGTGQSFDYNQKCNSCSGIGKKSSSSENVFKICESCAGKGFFKSNCEKCNGLGSLEKDFEIKIEIPAGIENNQTLKVNGASDYFFDKRMNRGLYTDGFVKIYVKEEPNMTVSGKDIISILELSLLDSLKGTIKKVKTIRGDMSLKINKNIQNGDKIRAQGYGVAGIGSHIFVIKVNYPEYSEELIEFLETKEKKVGE